MDYLLNHLTPARHGWYFMLPTIGVWPNTPPLQIITYLQLLKLVGRIRYGGDECGGHID
ncbi:hypothetical protein M405DRAFT_816014 [Rhizopogon salebrosus TDB-379]|nr:hypothetical protein M405DRAFT_816014 [Rhizopogon salebrosus TDB-379]